MKKVKVFSIFFFIILYRLVFSYPSNMLDFNNNPRYLVTESKYFRFYYPYSFRKVMPLIMAYGDIVFDSLTNFFGYKPKEKTDVIINDADFSNGWAAAGINTIALWPTGMEYLLRGTHEWLRDVFAHEFTHIITIQPLYKSTPSISDIRIGYFSSQDEKNYKSLMIAIPFNIAPIWFLEGLAQYGSYTMQGDRFDSHRKMMLRVDAFNNNLLTLNEIKVFSKNGRDAERVYNHGFSLVKYIIENYGRDKVVEVIKNTSKLSNITFDMSFKRTMGISLKDVYKNWKDSLKRDADSIYNVLKDSLTEVKVLTNIGYYNVYPFFNQGDLFYLSTYKTDFGPLFLFKNGKLLKEGVNFSFSLSPDRSFYVMATFGKRGAFYKDLYIYYLKDKNKLKVRKKKLLWKRSRIIYTAISPDSRFIAYVRNKPGYSVIGIIDTSGKKIIEFDKIEDKRAIFYTPRWDDSSQKVFFSYFTDESRNIGVFDLEKKTITPIINEKYYDERDPFYYKGKLYFSADYNNDIFNIYMYDLKTKKLYKITNLFSGGFMPTVNGDSLIFVEYRRNGYQVVLDTSLVQKEFFVIKREGYTGLHIKVKKYSIKYNTKKYYPYPTKHIFSPTVYSDYLGEERTLKTGLSGFFFDPLMRVNLGLYGAVNLLNITDYGRDIDFGYMAQFKLLPFTIYNEGSYSKVKDTVMYKEEINDSIIVDNINYITFQDGISLRYQINRISKFHLFYKYISASTSFYNNPVVDFNYTFYKGYSIGLMYTIMSEEFRKEFLIDPRGLFVKFRATYNNDKLMKRGNFYEVFYYTPAGVLKPRDTTYVYPSMYISTSYYTKFFKFDNITLGIDLNYLTFFNTEIDSFFYIPNSGLMGITSYPLKKDRNTWYYSGTNNLYFRSFFRFPIISHIDKSIGFMYIDRFYSTIFYEYALSTDHLFKLSDFSNSLKGVGFSFRLENILGSSYPFLIEFITSTPLENYKPNFYNTIFYIKAGLSLDYIKNIDAIF